MDKHIITAGVDYDTLLADVGRVVLAALAKHGPTAAAPAPAPEQLLDIPAAAELLGVTCQTIHVWKREQRLPFHKVGGRVYFKRSEVLAALSTPTAPNGRRSTPRKGNAAGKHTASTGAATPTGKGTKAKGVSK